MSPNRLTEGGPIHLVRPSSMKKLSNLPNLTELTYRSIKEQLLDGTLAEGTRLTEEQLASQLGISKSPVREALNRLEAEGLISIVLLPTPRGLVIAQPRAGRT